LWGAHFSLLLLISKCDNFVLVLSHSIPTIKYALIVLYPCYSKLTSHDVSAKDPKPKDPNLGSGYGPWGITKISMVENMQNDMDMK
jgi:hypothetical protein